MTSRAAVVFSSPGCTGRSGRSPKSSKHSRLGGRPGRRSMPTRRSPGSSSERSWCSPIANERRVRVALASKVLVITGGPAEMIVPLDQHDVGARPRRRPTRLDEAATRALSRRKPGPAHRSACRALEMWPRGFRRGSVLTYRIRGMDGLQLFGEIKRRFPDLPVMMVTAYGADERRRAGGLRAAEFLTKPVDSARLKAQLRQ